MTHPRDAWARLGALLIERRVDLDPRYTSREAFARETGLNPRLVADLENHRRNRYKASSLQSVEKQYHLRPGNIERILDGGDLEPLPYPSEGSEDWWRQQPDDYDSPMPWSELTEPEQWLWHTPGRDRDQKRALSTFDRTIVATMVRRESAGDPGMHPVVDGPPRPASDIRARRRDAS